MTTGEMIARGREVFDREVEGLRAVRASLDETFARAVDMMLDCSSAGGLVVVTGVGKSLHVAEKMGAIFSSTGTRAFVLNPVQAMHGDLGMVASGDLLLALSFSGESEEVVRLIPAIRRHGLKVIAVTGNADSTLAQLADLHLAVPCGKEACPFGMAPTTSATATMVLGDALAMTLIEARRFSLSDYAANHPAGAIGRALVLKVSDIMRTGARFAVVAPTASVMDALLAMTAAKGGCAVVAERSGKLAGIFTDGDFRRIVAQRNDSSVLSEPLSNVMTASPQFVYGDAYAADILKIFEHRRIDDLPVCDRSGRVIGLVDIQDLPKMKVL